MDRRDACLAAIGTIYDAALDPGRWRDAIGSLVGCVGGYGGNLVVIRDRDRALPFWASVGLEEGERDYQEWVHRIDPAITYAHQHPRQSIQYDYHYIDERGMDASPYYAWLAKYGGRYCIVGRVYAGHDHQGFISVQRRWRDGHVEQAEIENFALLVPHFERAVQVAFRLEDVAAQLTAGEWVLERLAQGVIFLDRQARVRFANAAARAVLEAGDGLARDREGLRAARPSDHDALSARIGAVLATASGAGTASGGALSVSRPSGRRDYALLVAPLPVSGFALAGAAAVVFVADPEAQEELPAEALQRLYRLTPAESRLAVELIVGRTPREAAEHLRISPSTARSYLDSILHKTGCRRQSELVALLMRSPARFANRS